MKTEAVIYEVLQTVYDGLLNMIPEECAITGLALHRAMRDEEINNKSSLIIFCPYMSSGELSSELSTSPKWKRGSTKPKDRKVSGTGLSDTINAMKKMEEIAEIAKKASISISSGYRPKGGVIIPKDSQEHSTEIYENHDGYKVIVRYLSRDETIESVIKKAPFRSNCVYMNGSGRMVEVVSGAIEDVLTKTLNLNNIARDANIDNLKQSVDVLRSAGWKVNFEEIKPTDVIIPAETDKIKVYKKRGLKAGKFDFDNGEILFTLKNKKNLSDVVKPIPSDLPLDVFNVSELTRMLRDKNGGNQSARLAFIRYVRDVCPILTDTGEASPIEEVRILKENPITLIQLRQNRRIFNTGGIERAGAYFDRLDMEVDLDEINVFDIDYSFLIPGIEITLDHKISLFYAYDINTGVIGVIVPLYAINRLYGDDTEIYRNMYNKFMNVLTNILQKPVFNKFTRNVSMTSPLSTANVRDLALCIRFDDVRTSPEKGLFDTILNTEVTRELNSLTETCLYESLDSYVRNALTKLINDTDTIVESAVEEVVEVVEEVVEVQTVASQPIPQQQYHVYTNDNNVWGTAVNTAFTTSYSISTSSRT